VARAAEEGDERKVRKLREKSEALGADAFMPIFLYAVIHAELPSPFQCLRFCQVHKDPPLSPPAAGAVCECLKVIPAAVFILQ